MEENYYSTGEVGELLNISQPTLRKKLKELGIPRFKRGKDSRENLIRESDYERLAKFVRGIHEITEE